MRYSEALSRRAAEIRTQAGRVSRGEMPAGFIPSGLRELDRRGGIKRGCLTIYGGSTGEGKSLLKLHLATSAAKAGLKVDLIDMEDPVERTADRSLSTSTGLNNERIGALSLSEVELDRIDAAVRSAEWAEMVEVEDGALTAGEALEYVRKSDADLVLVDYLQGFPDGDGGLERTIAGFCWDANKWAQEKGAAVVAFSQVKPEVEYRGLRMAEAAQRRNPEAAPYVEGFAPFGPSDLAWCTAAGQRCKELGYLFRPGRYARRFDATAKDDVLELRFPKRNWGAEGVIKVGFDPKQARLHDLTERTT